MLTLPRSNETTIAEEESTCRAAIHRVGWTLRGGRAPMWPLRPLAVVELLTHAGYDLDIDLIAELGSRGYLLLPDSGFWDARNVLALVGVLEGRRHWLPNTHHDAKQHEAWRDLISIRQDGGKAVRAQLNEFNRDGAKRHDARALLVMLTEAENRSIREGMLTWLLLTLEVDHGIRL